MRSKRLFLGRFAAASLLAVAELAAGLVLVVPSAGPAAAQGGFPFFPFFESRPRRERDRDFRQAPSAPPPQADFSRAPAPPRKPADAPAPTTTVAVLGDGFADWLAYGLEDAFSDTPEVGILRKHKTYSSLIRYESRRDAQEWPQVARQILAQDKPSFVVMMIGLGDRVPLREPAAPARSGNQRGQQNQPAQQQQDTPAASAEANDDPDSQEAQVAAPERGRPGSGPSHEFRSEKWAELYGKKIEDTITALKSAGVPVLWVGLPSIRGTKSTSDVIYLNNLYRSHAEKNGVVYIDIWDGFVDEGGRYALQGPDLEGQNRRLRTQDGVHFTKFGARKLAHYVEREIRRMMTVKVTPVALPVGPDPAAQGPASAARPSEPAARPLAGPVLPLNANVSATDELLGGSGNRQSGADAVATRVLVKGEPIAAPAGRADDFAWPRRSPSVTAPGPATPSPPVAAVDPGRSEPPARTPAKPETAAAPPAAASPPPRRPSASANRESAPAREGARERPPARARVTNPERRAAQQQQDPRAPRPPGAIPDSLIPFFRPVR